MKFWFWNIIFFNTDFLYSESWYCKVVVGNVLIFLERLNTLNWGSTSLVIWSILVIFPSPSLSSPASFPLSLLPSFLSSYFALFLLHFLILYVYPWPSFFLLPCWKSILKKKLFGKLKVSVSEKHLLKSLAKERDFSRSHPWECVLKKDLTLRIMLLKLD